MCSGYLGDGVQPAAPSQAPLQSSETKDKVPECSRVIHAGRSYAFSGKRGKVSQQHLTPIPTLPSVHGPVASRPDIWKAEACLGGERAPTEEKLREGKTGPRVEAQDRGYLKHPADRWGRPASAGPGTRGTGHPAYAGTLVRIGACTQWTAFWARGLPHSLTCDVARQHKGVGWNSGLRGKSETLPGEGPRCGKRPWAVEPCAQEVVSGLPESFPLFFGSRPSKSFCQKKH